MATPPKRRPEDTEEEYQRRLQFFNDLNHPSLDVLNRLERLEKRTEEIKKLIDEVEALGNEVRRRERL